MRTCLLSLIFLSSRLFAASGDCITDEQMHFEADMPKDQYEWYFTVFDESHTQASLTFPAELNGATFFQVLAQKRDDTLFEYAYPIEALDHPLTTDAKQIEFIISNDQLPALEIHLQYMGRANVGCTGNKSYSYFLKAM